MVYQCKSAVFTVHGIVLPSCWKYIQPLRSTTPIYCKSHDTIIIYGMLRDLHNRGALGCVNYAASYTDVHVCNLLCVSLYVTQYGSTACVYRDGPGFLALCVYLRKFQLSLSVCGVLDF